MTPLSPDLLQDLQRRRWFGAKGRAVEGGTLVDRGTWQTDGVEVRVELVDVAYASGAPDRYLLARQGDDLDALGEPRVARALLHQMRQGATLATERGGALLFRPTSVLGTISEEATEPPRLLGAEQSNTSLRYGDTLILKFFRRLQPGIHPELEVGRFLTERTAFRNTPLLAGSLEYQAADGRPWASGVLQCFVVSRGDAWTTMLQRLRALAIGGSQPQAVAPIGRLGEVTAALHLALASVDDAPEFVPRVIRPEDVAEWTGSIVDEVARAVAALGAHGITLDSAPLLRHTQGLAALQGSLMIRHHGDYHLGQVLEREDGDMVIIDFEGEPSKPLALRRERRTPLRDVAGMLRSLDYARATVLREAGSGAEIPLNAWYHAARATFLERYLATARRERPDLLPAQPRAALAALEVEKAAYEVLYELNNRPDWVPIPLAALASSVS